MFPTMMQLFLGERKESGDQHWTSHKIRYSVDKLWDFAKRKGDLREILISELDHGFENTNTDEEKDDPEFAERASKVDMSKPILVISEKGVLWPADGNHRLWRKKQSGAKSIAGYVIDHDELPEDAIDPKKGVQKES